ncbi:MAG TPA: hypothetical protein VF175_15440, partial [Lacipirellula sp.]
MICPRSRCRVLLAAFMLVGFAARPSAAHFAWLATDEQGRALLFFGESPEDRTYHVPDAVAKAVVFARNADEKPKAIELAAVEEEDFIGRRSNEAVPADAA